jgi:hypothetical protein
MTMLLLVMVITRLATAAAGAASGAVASGRMQLAGSATAAADVSSDACVRVMAFGLWCSLQSLLATSGRNSWWSQTKHAE